MGSRRSPGPLAGFRIASIRDGARVFRELPPGFQALSGGVKVGWHERGRARRGFVLPWPGSKRGRGDPGDCADCDDARPSAHGQGFGRRCFKANETLAERVWAKSDSKLWPGSNAGSPGGWGRRPEVDAPGRGPRRGLARCVSSTPATHSLSPAIV